MSVIVRKAKAVDMLSIMPKSLINNCMITRGISQVTDGNSYTGVCDEGIICVGGMTNLWGGVNQAWLLPSKLIYKYPKSFHKGAKMILKIMKDKSDRLQITVDADDDESVAWATRVGFEIESLMKRYGATGEDNYMMVMK